MATEKQSNAIVIPENWDELTEEEQDTWVEAALTELFSSD